MTNKELAEKLLQLGGTKMVKFVQPDCDGLAFSVPVTEVGLSEDCETMFLFGDLGLSEYCFKDGSQFKRHKFKLLKGGLTDE